MIDNKLKLIILFTISSMSVVRATEIDIVKKWFELSRLSQNVGFSLEKTAMLAGRPESLTYQNGMKKIDLALQYLVKRKVLVEKQIVVNFSLDDKIGNSYFKLLEFADLLVNDYGYFTALEMCDIGVETKLADFGKGANYTLKVRLPKEGMDKFTQLIKKLPIYVKTLK